MHYPTWATGDNSDQSKLSDLPLPETHCPVVTMTDENSFEVDEVDDFPVVPLMDLGSSDVLKAVLKAKDGMPSQFQSYWEMDEKGIEEDTEEEIQNDPYKKILWAAEYNQLEIAEAMLKENPDLVNSRDADKYTPLHRACYNGHLDMVRLLLANNADILAKTVDGWHPLHSASRWNQAEVASLLLQNGAMINAQTAGGQTALHLAASELGSRETLQLLLMNSHIDPSIKNYVGETARDICNRSSHLSALFEVTDNSINSLQ